MSTNLSIESDEVENLLRECDAIISKYQDLECNVTATTTSITNDLQTLRDQIDTICENVSVEMNNRTLTDDQSLEIEEIQLEDDGINNLVTVNNENDSINNLVTVNNESQDDIVFVGSSNFGASIPIIDLCSPVRTAYVPRKRNSAITSVVEIIDIKENGSLSKHLKRKNDPEDLATFGKSQPKVQCAICLDSALKRIPTTTTCGHIFCNKCIVLALKSCGKCPLCKTKKPKLIKLYGLN